MNAMSDGLVSATMNNRCLTCGAERDQPCREPSGRKRRAGLHKSRSILGGIMHIAVLTAVVNRPSGAAVIGALGRAFTNDVKRSMGQPCP